MSRFRNIDKDFLECYYIARIEGYIFFGVSWGRGTGLFYGKMPYSEYIRGEGINNSSNITWLLRNTCACVE